MLGRVPGGKHPVAYYASGSVFAPAPVCGRQQRPGGILAVIPEGPQLSRQVVAIIDAADRSYREPGVWILGKEIRRARAVGI
jgi:hypothetical protein